MTDLLTQRQTVVCCRCGESLQLGISKPGERYREIARAFGWRFQRRPKRWTCPKCQKRPSLSGAQTSGE